MIQTWLLVIAKEFNYLFKKGKIYAIIGHNGCGKSTLVNLLIGLIQENLEGDIHYNNINAKIIDYYDLRLNHVSMVQQNNEYRNLKVRELLKENCCFNNDEELRTIIEKIDSKLFVSETFNIFHYLDKDLYSLSGGELKRVHILRALLKNKEVLILDEPTTALDISSINMLKDILIKIKTDKIIIIISHNNDIKSIADEVIKL